MNTGIKVVLDDKGLYAGVNIVCHAGHTHFIETDWVPPGKERSPYHTRSSIEAYWTFNGNFELPSVTPSVKTISGHYGKPGQKRGNCYCDWLERYPDAEPMSPAHHCYLCHFVLTNGMMSYAADCSHEYVNKVLALVPSSSILPPRQLHRLPARFVQKVKTYAYWRLYWDARPRGDKGGSCEYYHGALNYLDVGPLGDHKFADHRKEILPEWPTHCDDCGALAPATANKQILYRDVYNTASGFPEPGDLYYDDLCQRLKDRDDEPGHCHQTHKPWTNCDGTHLIGVLPTGRHWDIDSRCNNCGLPEDTLHRCWARHGKPELGQPVHVDKNGLTCSAGGGSIDVKGENQAWHGFLHNGIWMQCGQK
jgi:hypothetical protein